MEQELFEFEIRPGLFCMHCRGDFHRKKYAHSRSLDSEMEESCKRRHLTVFLAESGCPELRTPDYVLTVGFLYLYFARFKQIFSQRSRWVGDIVTAKEFKVLLGG